VTQKKEWRVRLGGIVAMAGDVSAAVARLQALAHEVVVARHSALDACVRCGAPVCEEVRNRRSACRGFVPAFAATAQLPQPSLVPGGRVHFFPSKAWIDRRRPWVTLRWPACNGVALRGALGCGGRPPAVPDAGSPHRRSCAMAMPPETAIGFDITDKHYVTQSLKGRPGQSRSLERGRGAGEPGNPAHTKRSRPLSPTRRPRLCGCGSRIPGVALELLRDAAHIQPTSRAIRTPAWIIAAPTGTPVKAQAAGASSISVIIL